MASKYSFVEETAESDPNLAQFSRLLGSLQYPLSPEGKRVLAAAQVGLKLIRERAAESRREKAQSKARSRKRATPLTAICGGTPMQEHKLPGCIQEMLAKHRLEERFPLN